MFQSKHSIGISKFSPLKEELSNNGSLSSNGNNDDHLNENINITTTKNKLSQSKRQQYSSIIHNLNDDNNNNNHSCHQNYQYPKMMIKSNYLLNTTTSSSSSTLVSNDKSSSSLNIIISDNDRQYKEPLTTIDDYNNQTTSGITVKVFIGAFVVFFTNSFASGYNIGVVNLPEQIFKTFFNNTLNHNRIVDPLDSNQIELIWSLAVSVLIIGAMITSIITGYLANLFGRRGVIFLNIMIGLIAMCLTWGSKYMTNVPMFMAGRLVAGFHTGIASSIVPMYLMEISPKSCSSLLGTLHVMGLNGGLCFAQIMGLESILGTARSWQLLFFVNAMFITVGLIGLFFMPESPVYLFVIKKREDSAIRVLEQIRKSPMEVADDLSNLRREQKCEEGNGNNSLLQLFKQSQFRKSLLIVCLLHAGQQLVGINAVFYYSTNTFHGVGLSQIQSQYGSIGCSLLNTLCAILASRLLKSFSSRTMLLVSTVGTIIGLLILPISMSFNDQFQWLNYVTIAMMFFYVFMFAIGQGPIPFMIGGQMFDRAAMSTGLSIGVFINWFCNFLVAFAFPLLVIQINQFVFFIFLAFDVLLFIFIISMVPKADDQSDEIGKKPLENSISE
ncbi:solute carrier family 2 -like [Dermatophagoides farinae]|uniref:Solute carrier family 2 -like n=1 Tax=Dermatophagoides farinae TaxID=6954 RepID=A0A9D4NZZ3_DERFA|nr:solute carrier family 2 -like [Dermatophagoides farinae]